MAEPEKDAGSNGDNGNGDGGKSRASESATYRAALEDILRAPSSNTDPYLGVPVAFKQLSRRVRLFLISLSDKDVDTLVKGIRLHQRAEATGRLGWKVVVWGFGAFGATILFGKQVGEAIDLVRNFLR